ncbi:hypothetical protein GGR21_002448 [Dysgonomonas hofstadii]|uniref:Uncharacterized protein n=1 Tax=Dysgonomonas hofstadii TaxID=637886 RepID=A0A840CVN6_9BACT|nr:hypothetical protein [Dysgonomonas hofstadii]MBB4036542.1 hypothetical protein [Dysgonomonas hofstadii]
MKTFIIEFDDLKEANVDSHKKLMDYILENKLEFWEYISHQIVLLTPDSFTASMLRATIKNIYGDGILLVVFEVSILDMAAFGPDGFMDFFEIAKHPDYVPLWERESGKPYDHSKVYKIFRDIQLRKRHFPG